MSLKGACIFGQSGGPTSVINSSAYGVIKTALESPEITMVLGASHGIKGILSDTLFDMGCESPEELALLKNTPSSALGSCRYKLAHYEDDDTDYKKLLEVFKKYNVRYFFYNGGNDSMDTCNKVSGYLKSVGYECNVIGVPKTIDNDLYGTDHCPGYGSAAKYIAASCMEIALDARVYDTGAVTVIECMGRNAGWLTAAASLASASGYGPDYIFMPEIPFDEDEFLRLVKEKYEQSGNCIAVISEGIKDKDGVFISEYAAKNLTADAFGHKQMGGAAVYLANAVKNKIGAKTRYIEFSLLQRCAAHSASSTDVEEAFLAGEYAVKAAVSGESDKMVVFKRNPGAGYSLQLALAPLSIAANTEHKFPPEWITPDKVGITQDFLEYALPLISGEASPPYKNGMPVFANLKKVRAKSL